MQLALQLYSHIHIKFVLDFLQHSEEAKIAKEVEAHERRIRKELEKQDMLNRKVLPVLYHCRCTCDMSSSLNSFTM